VSQGWFPDLAEEFPWKCTAVQPPHDLLTMNFCQTDFVKSVHSLAPSSNCSNDYMRFINLRHEDTLLVCVSSPWLNNYSFSSYHLKPNMWSLWRGKKNVTYVMYIAKLRDGSKKSQDFFQNTLEEGLRWKRREKMDSNKKI
jgi:hypothetical protein